MLVLFRNLFAPPRDLILILAGLWVGLILAKKRSNRYKITASTLSDLVLTMSIAYLLGGRILFALEHISAFTQSPISMISINIDLFDSWGAFIAAVIAGLVYGQRRKLSLWLTLDALAILFSCLALGLALSHLASGAAFGRETELPWAIYLWGAMRHPTQFYEVGASVLTFGLIWNRKPNLKPGSDFMFFIALVSFSRLIIEAFRGDSTLVLGGLRLAQIVSWLTLAISLMCLEFLNPMDLETNPAMKIDQSNNAVTQLRTENSYGKAHPKKRTHEVNPNSIKTDLKPRRFR
jgi:phosphatidylglycerol:prolipoprotein diacylglycerol transferase